jgi:hypothetical protein
MPKKLTQEDAIRRFLDAHQGRYDYSRVVYAGANSKVDVICAEHGVFQIQPQHHWNGSGCRKCYFEGGRITRDEFVERAIAANGEAFDYSEVPDPFPGSQAKLRIRCRSHDIVFEQAVAGHIDGHSGCPECKLEMQRGTGSSRGVRTTKSQATEMFIGRAEGVHGKRYDYSSVEYRVVAEKVEIRCLEHGSFLQTPGNHLSGTGCPQCAIARRRRDTFKEHCAAAGINYHRALKRRQAGMSEEKILQDGYVRSEKLTKTAISVSGVHYPNIAEACRALEPVASGTTILRWIESGTTAEEAFRKIPNPGYAQGIIYLVTHVSTGKRYVGLTLMSLEERWKYHQEQAAAGQIRSNASLHFAIRKFGAALFDVKHIDTGTTKADLEGKEIAWIKKLGTLAPAGFNLNGGGASGGSNRLATVMDGRRFESRKAAIKYIAETRNISNAAAKKRLEIGRIDVKPPAKKGTSLVKTKEYKAWSAMKDASRPGNKSSIPGLTMHPEWKESFELWLAELGLAPTVKHRFCRLDKRLGFAPGNCAWMTSSEDTAARLQSGQVLFNAVKPKRQMSAISAHGTV